MDNKILDSTFISRRPLMPVIEFFENGKKIQKHIVADCMVVGRSQQCDLSVDDDKLSRNHFMLIRVDGKFEVKDLNSSNGLVVNGKKVKKAILTGNDKIVAGTTSFSFVLTRDDLRSSKVSLESISIDKGSFEKKYTPKMSKFTRKNIITAASLSILAFAFTWIVLGGEQEARVITQSKQKQLKELLTVDQEVSIAKLSEKDKVQAMNFFRLAEYHFKARNFSLAKKSMESYFAMVPSSLIAPAFIATCEEVLSNSGLADNKLDELEKEAQKRELITKLLDQGSQALNRGEYDEAINIYSKILEIDEYNNPAYDGILMAQAEVAKQQQKLVESTELAQAPQAEIYAQEMERSFRAQDFAKAYEISNRIIAMGQDQSGREPFIKAFRMKGKVISVTNKMFGPMIKEAGVLAKADAEDEAIKVYQKVLAVFPYQTSAKSGLDSLLKLRHEKAKLLYSTALVEASYPDMTSSNSKLRAVMNLVPASDIYHQKAARMLKKQS